MLTKSIKTFILLAVVSLWHSGLASAQSETKPTQAKPSARYPYKYVPNPTGKPIARLSTGKSLPTVAKEKVERIKIHSPFVPPPPPVPIGAGASLAPGLGLSIPLGWQSKKDLEKSLVEMSGQLDAVGKAYESKLAIAQSRRERAKSFESLYQEGIVSKHELEEAQSDADTSEAELGQLRDQVSNLKDGVGAINTQLKGLDHSHKK